MNLSCTNDHTQPATIAECNGIQELAQAVGKAWEAAKVAKNEVYKKMNSDRMKTADLALVRFLIKEDEGFNPGVWYPGSKFATIKSTTSFKRKVKEVEKQVDGWKWSSWKS